MKLYSIVMTLITILLSTDILLRELSPSPFDIHDNHFSPGRPYFPGLSHESPAALPRPFLSEASSPAIDQMQQAAWRSLGAFCVDISGKPALSLRFGPPPCRAGIRLADLSFYDGEVVIGSMDSAFKIIGSIGLELSGHTSTETGP